MKKSPVVAKTRIRQNDAKSSLLNNKRDFSDSANEFDLNSDASGKYIFDLEKLALMVDKNQENSMQRQIAPLHCLMTMIQLKGHLKERAIK